MLRVLFISMALCTEQAKQELRPQMDPIIIIKSKVTNPFLEVSSLSLQDYCDYIRALIAVLLLFGK